MIQGAEENMPQGRKVPDDVRIGACADYILGRSTHEIEKRWGVSIRTVSGWIKRTGSFKLRQIHKSRGERCPAEQVGR